jgi:hypothetical protein
MKAYDGLFALPIPSSVLAAIATLVDRGLPQNIDAPTTTVRPPDTPVLV